MGNDIPLRYAFIAPALFGASLFAAGLITLAAGLPDDTAHTISSIIVLLAMIRLYRSAGLGIDSLGHSLGLAAVLSAISAGIVLQAVSIGAIALLFQGRYRFHCRHPAPLPARLAVIDPLAEELCFRGVSLTALERHGLPFWAANLVQAALFAAFHFNIVQSAYAFACGLVLGGLRQRDGIASSAIAHCACNLSGVILGMILAGVI